MLARGERGASANWLARFRDTKKRCRSDSVRWTPAPGGGWGFRRPNPRRRRNDGSAV